MTAIGRNSHSLSLFSLGRISCVLGLAAFLAACEREPETPPEPEAALPPSVLYTATDFASLPGWQADNLEDVALAFGRSCDRLLRTDPSRSVGLDHVPMTAADWKAVCDGLPAAADAETLRRYFEDSFTPFSVRSAGQGEAEPAQDDADIGLFTGYFEAELRGSRAQSEAFATPLYGRPSDLVSVDLGRFDPELKGRAVVGTVADGRLLPYPTRAEIEAGALENQGLELLWIDDPVDVFLLQVQGSGRVLLESGAVVRVGFAAHNGHGYKSIGSRLIELGELESHQASWDGIRGWIDANPSRASELFAFNPRFIFFRELTGDGPIGAEGVALTPRRSMAVDTRYVPLGVPLWLDTTVPGTSGDPLRRLMVAQDKGSAIKGIVRGDFFWGYGASALAEAGRMKSQGRYFVLLPNQVADRLQAGT